MMNTHSLDIRDIWAYLDIEDIDEPSIPLDILHEERASSLTVSVMVDTGDSTEVEK